MNKHLTLFFIAAMALASQVTAQIQSRPLGGADVNKRPFGYTGLIAVHSRSNISTGSACVVLNPKTIFSAAHVYFSKENYEDGIDPYAGDIWFYPKYHGTHFPEKAEGRRVRGVFAFPSYTDRYRDYGPEKPALAALDFVVGFSYYPLGEPEVLLPSQFANGVQLVTSNRTKDIVGYPSHNYPDNDPDKYRMHHTGIFEAGFHPVIEQFFYLGGVSTGKGNSGGPVFVKDGTDYVYAATLISGSRAAENGSDTSGIYVLSDDIVPLVRLAAMETDRQIMEEKINLPAISSRYGGTVTPPPRPHESKGRDRGNNCQWLDGTRSPRPRLGTTSAFQRQSHAGHLWFWRPTITNSRLQRRNHVDEQP